METITSGSAGQTTSKDSSMQAVPPSAAAPDGSVSAVAGRASTSREASPLTLDKDSVTQLPNRPSSSDRKKGQEAQRSSTLKPPTGLANIASFCLCFFLVQIIVWPFLSPVLSGHSSLLKVSWRLTGLDTDTIVPQHCFNVNHKGSLLVKSKDVKLFGCEKA